jgi:hypothetical protein
MWEGEGKGRKEKKKKRKNGGQLNLLLPKEFFDVLASDMSKNYIY